MDKITRADIESALANKLNENQMKIMLIIKLIVMGLIKRQEVFS